MVDIPAYCKHCGAQFVVSNFLGGSFNADITLSGNLVDCPNCGREARIVDGDFKLNDDELILVDGPPMTRVMMARLKEVAKKGPAKRI